MTDDFTRALVTVWVAYLLATLVPGPNVICVSSNALVAGRARGLAAAAGVAAATFAWSTLGIAGLGALLETRPDLMPWLRWTGAIVMFYLGCATLRPAPGGARRGAATGGFVGGVLTGCTNPLAALFWCTAAGTILATSPSRGEIAMYLTCCSATALTIYGTLAISVACVTGPASARRAAMLRVVCGGSFLLLAGLLVTT